MSGFRRAPAREAPKITPIPAAAKSLVPGDRLLAAGALEVVVLVREGVPGSEFYALVEGTVTASVYGEKLATLTAGDFFGEMSLLEHAPRAATIVAETDVTLLVAEPRGFAALWSASPSVGVRMLRTMSSRLRSVEAAAHR